MSAEPVNGWDARCLAVVEATFGTTPDPAAAQALEFISLSMGPSELGNTRPKKDRNVGRGMQNAYVEGRVQPIAFSLETSVKSRAAVDTVPHESALLKAAGLGQTVNSSTSVAYALDAAPKENAIATGLSLYRMLGASPYGYEAEQLQGGIVKSLLFTGGDKELTLKASGDARSKLHMGYLSSVTLADGSVTSMTITAEESYRLSVGYYLIESEIIHIDAVTAGATSCTIARAQLSSTGAAHTAKPVSAYFPTPSFSGSPISEANCTATLGGVTCRVVSSQIEFTSGLEPLPGESGSKYFQSFKTLRYACKASFKTVLHREEVSWLGKARARTNVALSLVYGATAGGIWTFSLPYCEIDPITVPDTANDVVMVDVSLRCKDSAGQDMLAITVT